MNQLTKPAPVSGHISTVPTGTASAVAQPESLFERFAWLYIFCREKLFRDDTERMISALWTENLPKAGMRLIELGSGPGFYSCRLAARFPQISVLGVDRSEKQVNRAREKATGKALRNCVFERSNVLALSCADESFDCLITSRLFTVLPKREQAVAEMFRVLRSSGRCFIAEPRYAFWASLPLFAMWILAGLTGYKNGYREPRKASVLPYDSFQHLLGTQSWARLRTWRDGRYQYALCEKG